MEFLADALLWERNSHGDIFIAEEIDLFGLLLDRFDAQTSHMFFWSVGLRHFAAHVQLSSQ